jgi:quinol monooxygenase YgiN
MYLRLVQMDVDPLREGEFTETYAGRIFPALARTAGCHYAALVVNAQKRERAVSVSLWESKDDADAYEQSGLYRELLDLCRPFFSASTTWQLRLSVDMRLEHVAVKAEPVIRAYVGASEHGTDANPRKVSCGFLRIVSMLVQPGQAEELTRLYRERVMAELRNEPGCCSIQLAESVSDPREFISFTIWESRHAAEQYEASGRFAELSAVLQPTLSALFRWKLHQQGEPGITTMTSDDMSLEAYVVLTARSFS